MRKNSKLEELAMRIAAAVWKSGPERRDLAWATVTEGTRCGFRSGARAAMEYLAEIEEITAGD